ncbi:MAG: MFS transporter [Chloroflexi bacterium]|jgi:MFS family permease|nr:MFS transporter [Chloroflexota bacterium]MBT7080130.1 MFS transporter [Chloroflexota bacterium]MBT7290208.1 MFS transporter [Chloroflexota bacterium]
MYVIGILSFILLLSTLVGAPVLPELSKELGASDTQVPIIVSSALATVVVLQFFSGTLADRFNPKRLLLVGALLGSVSSLLCVVATDWSQLLALRIIGGVADAISMPVLLLITATLGKDKPGKFFGILRSSQGLSFIAGPALGAAFSLISLRSPFLIDGILSLVAVVAIALLMRDEVKKEGEHAPNPNLLKTLKTIFIDKRIYAYILLGMSALFGFSIVYTFVASKSKILGFTPWQLGLIITAGALVFTIVSFFTGILSDRGYRKHMVITSQIIIITSGIGLALWGNSYTSIILIYSLFCAGEAMAFLLSFVYGAKIFESRHMGTAMGAFDSVIDLSLMIGPIIGISVYAATQQFAPVFYIVCIPAVLGLVGMTFHRAFDVK